VFGGVWRFHLLSEVQTFTQPDWFKSIAFHNHTSVIRPDRLRSIAFHRSWVVSVCRTYPRDLQKQQFFLSNVTQPDRLRSIAFHSLPTRPTRRRSSSSCRFSRPNRIEFPVLELNQGIGVPNLGGLNLTDQRYLIRI